MKDGKKIGKTIELTTSAQIAAWRQRLDVISLFSKVNRERTSSASTRIRWS